MSDPTDRQLARVKQIIAHQALWDRSEMLTLMDWMVAEIERLRAGGCARDQRTTQYCAEAAGLQAELDALKFTLKTTQDAWSVAVQINDNLRGLLDTERRELERVKVALANAASERDRNREDAELFRFWIAQAESRPGRCAQFLAGCLNREDYRVALQALMREDARNG